MKSKSLYRWVFAAILLAITIVFGRFFLLPIPWTHGNINLSDASIFVASALLGPLPSGLIGGLGTAFLDLISGYTQYAPFSFVAHGLEGLLAGWLYQRFGKHRLGQWVSLAVGAFVMVVGYLFADSLLYNWTAGVLGIGTNFLQGLVGVAVAQLIIPRLKDRF
ncbi:ECF transporter S component [Lactobacillus alvi]|uniref:ECF transporter S component n=1 Tax=Limosilactobacillus alvi TaxID=990412 RepID=A0ABS2EPQ4_9LACO|nr:ECF transporter S component [Limosilactobacillus alvi]MBM6754398.1 ECF transporter S component [Limosilactobacillus alvi]